MERFIHITRLSTDWWKFNSNGFTNNEGIF